MNIGVNTLLYKELTPKEAAKKIKADGFDAVHLFLDFEGWRQFPFWYDPDRVDLKSMNAAKCKEFRSYFEDQGLEICMLGGFTELVDPDEKNRKRDIQNLKDFLHLAKDLGSPVVATEAGAFPAAEDRCSHISLMRLEDSLHQVMPVVEETDTVLAFEPCSSGWWDGQDHARLLETSVAANMYQRFSDPRLKCLLDPVNLHLTDTIETCCANLGAWTVGVHIKDYLVEDRATYAGC
jgi:sugar phosphate isomerase/epimerase